jgi:CheY-like chemotaxis protein
MHHRGLAPIKLAMLVLGAAAPSLAAVGAALGAAATGQLDRRRKVVVIGDNASSLSLVQLVFRGRPNIHLITATSGALGPQLVREHHPDLVLLDLHLSDMSGEEVLARLKADPATRPVPVVILSADASARRLERLMGRGARSCLLHPIDVDELLAVVDHVVSDSRRAAA